MVHHGKVLINPSSTTIISHTSLQVASISIQYLEVALDQFFLGYEQATNVEPL
jgi:hypothetical protein